MTTILLVGVGGFVGANVRFGIASWSARRFGTHFPLGTLIANLSGSFLIGLLLGLVDDREVRLLLATGFLGAETTFSTFAVETVQLVERGTRSRAAFNIVANSLGSLGAVAAGMIVAWLIRDLA